MMRAVRRQSLSLVIPLFNEEENIAHAIACAVDALDEQVGDYEIIVIDDASTDRSNEILVAAARANPRLRVIRNEVNAGLGTSLRQGFEAAHKDLVLYMDADLPFDPAVTGEAVRALEITRSDMIAGYRHDRTLEGLGRTVQSYLFNALIGVLFGWPHRDINFSFKLVRREVLEAIDLRSSGALIDAELVVKAKNLGFAVQQIGVNYFPRSRGRSKLSSSRVVWQLLGELRRLHPGMRRPVRRTDVAHRAAAARPVAETLRSLPSSESDATRT